MARSRADIVNEALEEIAEKEDVLFVLSLNEWPVRRRFIVETTGLRDDLVLRALAKLANVELLEQTDGLTFKIARADVAAEVRERIDPQVRRQLHEVCLSYGFEHGEPAAGFELHHLIGAERWDEAARDLLSQARGEVTHQDKPRLVSLLKKALNGLAGDEADAPADPLGRELAVTLIEVGIGWTKPRELQTRLNRLAALEDLDEELRERLAVADASLAAEKARKKKEAAAAKSEEANAATAAAPEAGAVGASESDASAAGAAS